MHTVFTTARVASASCRCLSAARPRPLRANGTIPGEPQERIRLPHAGSVNWVPVSPAPQTPPCRRTQRVVVLDCVVNEGEKLR
jgi:hypothetical protein